jgi:hypothetical protein
MNHKANHSQREIGHADHEIDALVVCGGHVRGVAVRTGRGDCFLSGRAGMDRERHGQVESHDENAENLFEPNHYFPLREIIGSL